VFEWGDMSIHGLLLQ